MVLDAAARRNLEADPLARRRRKKQKPRRAAGQNGDVHGRGGLLRKWFDQPLLSLEKIHNRQAAVAEAAGDAPCCAATCAMLCAASPTWSA